MASAVSYFVLNVGLLRLVQVNLNDTRAIEFDADTLADDLSRVDQIVQGVLMDSGKSTATNEKHSYIIIRFDISKQLIPLQSFLHILA